MGLFDLEYGTATYEEPAEEAPAPAAALSWFDQVKEAIVPESYGESVVNAIYSNPGNTLKPDPAYDVEDLSSPNVYVKAKGAVADAASALTGFGKTALFVVVGFVLLAIVLHAGTTALVRR